MRHHSFSARLCQRLTTLWVKNFLLISNPNLPFLSLKPFLDFSKVFDTVSHNISVMKLRKCEIHEWMVRWIDNWLTGIAQRVVISITESG